ncbi:MAG: L-glutamate gamma-semialdehyde dehydrogenase [Cytophagaceae bacterium]
MNQPLNEPILDYLKGSKERSLLESTIKDLSDKIIDIPMYIGNQKITTSVKKTIHPPHQHQSTLATFSEGDKSQVELAITAALDAKQAWMNKSIEERSSIFLKAADLLSTKYRALINAATMLGQSKNVYQAEIDSACELIDFFRFNAYYALQIQQTQPFSPNGIQNELEYRPLEGFVVAITPFNFTAIAGNLPSAPAIMGNTVVWKPAYTQIYAAHFTMEILLEAGLPPGVINLIYVDGPVLGEVCFTHPEFSGLHFTGSTKVFNQIQHTIQSNSHLYKNYPKIVGETGGKDFVLVHPKTNIKAVATALIRGAFEYQGQKCSAASRAYIPASIWAELWATMKLWLDEITIGSVTEFQHFMNAVIDQTAFNKITSYIEYCKNNSDAEIIYGGTYSDEVGYFIQPTIVLTKNPKNKTMVEEIFGPVLTIYIYQDSDFDSVLDLVNASTAFALTGSIFSDDASVIEKVKNKLQYAAGNFYINDKPTGAVVNQQPFGGARKSGTNDKAGSIYNLTRWISPRTIKRNLAPPENPFYPYMK